MTSLSTDRVRLAHLLERQTLTVDVAPALAGPALLDRVGELNRRRFVPVLAQVIEEFDTPGALVRIDTLSIALGSFAPDDLDRGAGILRDRLRRALADALGVDGQRPSYEREDRALVSSFEHYLLHGAWPGARAIALTLRPADMLAQLVAEDPLALVAMLRRRGSSDALLRRLVRQMPEALLAALLHRLEPVHAAYILSYVGEVRESHAAERLISANPAELAEMLWIIVLRDTLQQSGLQANRKAFLRRLLLQLARSGGTTLAALIAQLRRGLPRVLARRRAPGSLVAVLSELIAEEPALLAVQPGIAELATLLGCASLSRREQRVARGLIAVVDPEQLRWMLQRLARDDAARLDASIAGVLSFAQTLGALWRIDAAGLPVALETVATSHAERSALLTLAARSARAGDSAAQAVKTLLAEMRGVAAEQIDLAPAEAVPRQRRAAPSDAYSALAQALAGAPHRPEPAAQALIREHLSRALATDPEQARRMLRAFASADAARLCALLGETDMPDQVARHLLAPHLYAALATMARVAQCTRAEWHLLLAVAAATQDEDFPETLLGRAIEALARARHVPPSRLRAQLARTAQTLPRRRPGAIFGEGAVAYPPSKPSQLGLGLRRGTGSSRADEARDFRRSRLEGNGRVDSSFASRSLPTGWRDTLADAFPTPARPSEGQRVEPRYLLADPAEEEVQTEYFGGMPADGDAALLASYLSTARAVARLSSRHAALEQFAFLCSQGAMLSPRARGEALTRLLPRLSGVTAATLRARLSPDPRSRTMLARTLAALPGTARARLALLSSIPKAEIRQVPVADLLALLFAALTGQAEGLAEPLSSESKGGRSSEQPRMAALLRARPFAALRLIAESPGAPGELAALLDKRHTAPLLFAAMAPAERARASALLRMLTSRAGRRAVDPAKVATALALAAAARDWRSQGGAGFAAEWLRQLEMRIGLAEQASVRRLLAKLEPLAPVASSDNGKSAREALSSDALPRAAALLGLPANSPTSSIRRKLDQPRNRTLVARELSEAELVRLLAILSPTGASGLLHATERLAAAWRACAAPLSRVAQWEAILAAAGSARPILQLANLLLDSTASTPVPLRLRVETMVAQSLEGMRDASLRVVLDLRESERRRRAAEASPTDAEEALALLYVANAGLVLASAFLPHLFQSLDYVEPDAEGGWRWRDAACQPRAVHLLQWLVNERTDAPEPQLALNKLLCGLPIAEPVAVEVELDERELRMAAMLLRTVLASWPPLADSGTTALRETFFQRPGRLTRSDAGWRLEVEKRVLDILLDQLPWGYSTILHPWMPAPLAVQWR